MVAIVAVEEDDDVGWVGGQVGESLQTGGSVAAFGLVNDFSAVLARYFGGAIGGAVVGDDDPADRRAWDFPQDQRESLLLV